ncbi:aldose epimerase family protein [Epilithonimonas xixisoli]|uniref:Aldose 1-epimerase n=1 Tax=Epilithonimonas xixisoli TaxID=1476462 RepID=A0A4R8IA30_9FLAO|nr:aldose epimerase family protein [Epilithonimonas xixisoli]TDX86877.1 aldose 1-epimerase [Epilithonimonas xixisoli]
MKKRLFKISVVLLTALSIWSCSKTEKPSDATMEKLSVSDYAVSPAGDSIKQYTLKNKNGMEAKIINYGAIITSLTAPDKDGKFQDIVLGYTKPEDYFNGNPYFFGALIGRYGNRIANAKFELDGKTYDLDKNDGPNHLHGGKKGFYTKLWKVDEKASNDHTLKLDYTSADGEEGYPGKLDVSVIYTLNDENALEIAYSATTDKKTIVNLTQHSYFNLSGNFNQPITDHELQLKAATFIPVNNTLIPTGELKPVAGTPFDFNQSKLIGKDIEASDEQLKLGKGYDHCWVLDGKGLRTIGSLYHPASGRVMEVITTEPGVQFYSGNFLDGKYDTKTGGKNEFRTGLCLETQHYPDSPNQPSFPSVVMEPGQKYETKTIYKFSVKK